MAAGTISLIVAAAVAARWIGKALSSLGEKTEKGGGTSDGARPPKALVDAVHLEVLRRVTGRARFEAVDVADEVTRANASRGVKEIRDASLVVESFWKDGTLAKLGYDRTPGGVFHPAEAKSSQKTPAPAPLAGRVVPLPTGSRIVPSEAPAPETIDPYRADEILGLSTDALRARALKIVPWRTAWIGRVDTIPPQSDERTAIIDRGLILRGLLRPEEIQEIHRVGDLWIRHHDAVKLAEATAYKTVERALEATRAERAAKKAEKKRAAAERRAAHAADVARRRAEDIIYLGRGVSGKLDDRRAHVEKLTTHRLPVLASPQDVAKALGLSIVELRGLCFHAEAAERTHYVYFEVPKRSGGTRLLAAPHQRLARAQRWILQNILAKLEVTEHAHGFVQGRCTVTNAKKHLARDVVVNLDLKDFFPSVTFYRVRGFFESVGYSPCAATVLGLLCTESSRSAVTHDGRKYWVAVGERALPQGACTSPALSNLVTRTLDRRLAGATKKVGWSYTRYADDLTFSAAAPEKAGMAHLLARVRHIVADEGFTINEKKGRVQRASRRQEVTGVIVNEKAGVRREDVRRLRAILHGAKKTGLSAQNREGRANFEAWLLGKIGYVTMIDAAKGQALRAAFDDVRGKG